VLKIILMGYYGFGNLGDDILMITAYKVCLDIFPPSEFIVCTESKNPTYIKKFIPGVRIVNSTANITADMVIHGGGGVFFDFTKSNLKYLVFNYLIKMFGYRNYARTYLWAKSLIGRPYIRTRSRVGLGIGIGTYTNSSNRFLVEILYLSTFDFVIVRDSQSYIYAGQYCRSSNIHQATDLAFLVDKWNPQHYKKIQNAQSIGLILRDWPTKNHSSVLLKVASILQSQGLEVKFFAFDSNADKQYIASVPDSSVVHIWQPEKMSIDDFIGELSKCKLVISSRAHGAIISACLGIPILCVAIEPKLARVAEMFKDSTRIIEEPFNEEEIVSIVQDSLRRLPMLEQATLQDVGRNKEEISRGIRLFHSFVDQRIS
jgi:polysaccharide pyruvyl transferase WcaK-like protein